MADEVMGIDRTKPLLVTPGGCETKMEDTVSRKGSCRRRGVWRRTSLDCLAWAILSAFFVGAAQPSSRAVDQDNSLTREFTSTERTTSGLVEDQLTYSLSWDRWKEDKAETKRTDQGYKALVDPSNPGFKKVENQSLMLMYGSFSEIDRYASSAPPEVFNRFAQQYREAFVAFTRMQLLEPMSEMFSGGIRKLAAAFRLRGDDQAATEFYQEEIDRCQKAGSTAQLARTMDGLGILLAGQGKMDAAERLFRDSLALRQKLNLADEARSWMLLAGLQALGVSISGGEDAFAQAMARLSAGRVNFGTMWMYSHQPTDLEVREVNALAPINELAWQFQANGQYPSAERVMSLALTAAEKWLKADDLRLVRQRNLAACCAYAAGKRPLALKLLQQANDAGSRYLNATTWPRGYESTTESVVRVQGDGTFTASFGTTEDLAQELIEQKGYAFHQQLEKRRRLAEPGVSPEAKALWQELVTQRTTYRDQLLAAHMGSSFPGTAGGGDVGALEAKLATAIGAPALDSGPSLVRLTAALPKGSAYVDYTLCDRWTEKISFTEEWCAVVIQPGRAPALARCGSLQTVRGQIDGYLWVAKAGNSNDSELGSASQTLYASLIAPVEKLLAPEAKTVFVCPDGPLASIGLAALLDEAGHFWCEKRDVRYITDARAMLKPATEVSLNTDRLVGLLGNPIYDAASTNSKTNSDLIEVDPFAGLPPELRKKVQGRESEILKQLQGNNDKILKRAPKPARKEHLEPLPGTLEEIKALQTFFGGAGLNVVSLLGSDATEPRFRSLNPCTILHLATHGDFIKEIPSHYQMPGSEAASEGLSKMAMIDSTGVRSGANQGSAVSPMMRSFLALVGAQTTLNQWDQGNFPKTAADGLLMADEVMDMDFSRTLLVTLSGCETGAGASVRGEGSVGIQRAFLIAGARHVLATLWPIQDIETVDFMKAFYARVVQAGEAPPAALSAVQRDLLVQRREKKGLATAVNLTAPFVLTSASQ
jgi:CHAT domain-containing protein/tetratricopeptide (TPR) repeat protein